MALLLAAQCGQGAFFWLVVLTFVFLGVAVVSSETFGIRLTRIPIRLRWDIRSLTI